MYQVELFDKLLNKINPTHLYELSSLQINKKDLSTLVSLIQYHEKRKTLKDKYHFYGTFNKKEKLDAAKELIEVF